MPASDVSQRGRLAARLRPSVLSVLAVLVVVAVTAALGGWLWSLAQDDDSAGPEEGITLQDVVDDRFTDQLVGREVTISGEVVAPLVPREAFWLGGRFGEPSVMVVAGREVLELSEGDVVRVTGVVRDIEDVEILSELVFAEGEGDTVDAIGPFEEHNVVTDASVTVLDDR